jgi:hypothetical protein
MKSQGRLHRWRVTSSNRKARSNGGLADLLLERLKGGEGLPKREHLKNQIAKLDRGDTGWWESAERRHLLRGLAEILRASQEDLLNPGAPQPGGSRFPVPEWPELGDLDVAHEEFVHDLGRIEGLWGREENLFEFLDSQFQGWVQMPSGAGRSLVVAWYETQRTQGRRAARGIAVRRLEEAVREAHGLIEGLVLVAEVAEFDLDRDSEVLARAGACPGLWVLSTAALPSKERDREGSRWTAWRSAPRGPWFASFVAFLARRRPNDDWKRFLKSAFRLDARRRLPLTPRDLLHLARAWSRSPEASDEDILARAVANFVDLRVRAALVPPGSDASVWLGSCAWEALQAALRKRWADPGLPWTGPLGTDEWRRLVPESLGPPTRRTAKSSSLEANAAMAVDLLVRAGLLTPDVDGTLSTSSILLDEFCGREEAAAMTGRASDSVAVSKAGLAGLGRTRRPVLDTALAEIDSIRLIRLADTAAQPDPSSDSLGGRALLDAVFCALGRRFEAEPSLAKRYATVAARVFSKVWKGVARIRTFRPTTTLPTRPAPGDDGVSGAADEDNSFVADCWSWSFAMEEAPPNVLIEQSEQWLFPGWFSELATPVAPLVTAPPLWERPDPSIAMAPWPAFERLQRNAERFLSHASMAVRTGEHRLYDFRGALIIQCALTNVPFPVAPSLWSLDPKGAWAVDLARRLHELTNDRRPRVVSYLWQSSAYDADRKSKSPVLARLAALSRFGDVGKWVLERIAPSDLDSAIEEDGLGRLDPPLLAELLHSLPPELARQVLRRMFENDDAQQQYGNLFDAVGLWRDPELLAEAAERLPRFAWQAYSRLWQIKAEFASAHAARLLRSNDPKHQELGRELIRVAGVEHAGLLSEVLEVLGTLEAGALPPWIPAWANRTISVGGPAADKAWKLLQRFPGQV